MISTTLTTARKRWRTAFATIKGNKNTSPRTLQLQSTYTVLENEPDSVSATIDKTRLLTIVKEKNVDVLADIGGVSEVARSLRSSLQGGISGSDDDVIWRKDNYGSNDYEGPPPKGFLYFVLHELKDPILFMLLVAAVLSFWLSVISALLSLLSVFVPVLFSGGNSWRKERLLKKQSKISDKSMVNVVRDNRQQQVLMIDVLVGDVVTLKTGDLVPADGLFIDDGHSLVIDESIFTGETDQVEVDSTSNTFLHMGSKVGHGHGQMLVTGVGMHTYWWDMMSSINQDASDETPLQARLRKLTSSIGKVGLLVGFLVLVVLVALYFAGTTLRDEEGEIKYVSGKTGMKSIMESMVQIVYKAVTIAVAAKPEGEGVPLALTLTLPYYMNKGGKTSRSSIIISVVRILFGVFTILVTSLPDGLPEYVNLIIIDIMKKTTANKGMLTKLFACETVGSATVICTNKTGTLTMNQMQVTRFWIGEKESPSPQNISPNILQLLQQGVASNTTGEVNLPFQGTTLEVSRSTGGSRISAVGGWISRITLISAVRDQISSLLSFFSMLWRPATHPGCPPLTGNRTENAIVSWGINEIGMDMAILKNSYTIIQAKSFDATKKRSGVMLQRNSDSTIHIHWKGAAEIILAMCSSFYTSDGTTKAMDENRRRERIGDIINSMASTSLCCIALAHRQVSREELKHILHERDLTLLGIVCLKDPCRPEVKNAVEACLRAGVKIKMMTGGDIFAAKAIASECGILRLLRTGQEEDVEVVEGAQFCDYSDEVRMQKVDKICVMARSSPLDKLLMVQSLKEKGHVVAVTAFGTTRAPALKEADVGLVMGIQGRKVGERSSRIINLEDDFSTVASILGWGRCIYGNIQKFNQYQVTVNVVALVVNFIGSVSTGDPPLGAVQLLWVNLLVDTLGAIALAIERPTIEPLNNPPVGRTAPIITNIMWRNLLCQALFQITVLLIMQFRGAYMFQVSTQARDTLIFTTFVLCQVFRELYSGWMKMQSVLEGFHRSQLIIGIVVATIVLQALMVEFLKKLKTLDRLNVQQWAVCTTIAFLSWPIEFLANFIPAPPEKWQFPTLFSGLVIRNWRINSDVNETLRVLGENSADFLHPL